MLPITVTNLSEIMPAAAKAGRAATFVGPLNAAMAEAEINTDLRIAAFLSQIAVESGELRYVRELWGPTAQQLKYEPPHALADRLGNTEKGDGFLYRGRGLIQITGRANYKACGAGLGMYLVGNPELLEQPLHAARSAGWYWRWRKINVPADRGDLRAVTRLVNGGLTHYAEREVYYKRALEVLGRGN